MGTRGTLEVLHMGAAKLCQRGAMCLLCMEQTEYFRRRVLRDRPYVRLEWCEKAVIEPEFVEVQADRRIRHWIFIRELGRYLRVITLPDGVTLHNAFPDRSFKPERHATRILQRN